MRSPKGKPRSNLRGCHVKELANLFSLSTLNHVHMLVMDPTNLLQHTHTHTHTHSFFRFSYECILNTKIFELKDCFNVAYAAALYVNEQVAKAVKRLFIKIPLLQKLVGRRNPGRVPGLATRCRSSRCGIPLLRHPATAISFLRHAITNTPDCTFPFKKYHEERGSRFIRNALKFLTDYTSS